MNSRKDFFFSLRFGMNLEDLEVLLSKNGSKKTNS